VSEPTVPPTDPATKPAEPTVTLPPDPHAPTQGVTGEPTAAQPIVRPVNVPGYEILGELGRGGMGVVYKARQAGLDRAVALKMILAGAHAGPEHRSRFQTEAAAIARLRHPHIVQVYHVGECDGNLFFAMELVEGGSLAAATDGPWNPWEAAELVEKLARAVHSVHDEGIVHRDLKPANVLLDADGEPKVVDFGLAKLAGGSRVEATVSGAVLGTPGYMAPEQAEGRTRDIGPHTDVYALGAVLYHLLTGRPPFQGDSPLATIRQIVSDDPVPPRERRPSVPPDLDAVCLKCLAKDPHDRYSSAFALAKDLRRAIDGEPVTARPPGLGRRLGKWWGAHPASGVALIVAAILWLPWFLLFALAGDYSTPLLFALLLVAIVRPTKRTLAVCGGLAVALIGLRYLLIPDALLLAISVAIPVVAAGLIGTVGRVVAWLMKREVLPTTLGAYFGTILGAVVACCGMFPIMGMTLGPEKAREYNEIQRTSKNQEEMNNRAVEWFKQLDYGKMLAVGIIWVLGATTVPAVLGAVLAGAATKRAEERHRR
jgi:predicted Ser/Thr protein kinase